ncbi:hypothetical protein, partial [Mesorhizobium intechi]|uniref:hypothetical protein n=1 Tax=Mesorhizobium intechi TaxID=537601 RepID=UPI001ABF714A
YMIVCGNDLSTPSRFRSKKGISISDNLKKFPRIYFERTNAISNKTRLCSAINIDDGNQKELFDFSINYASSCLVISAKKIEEVKHEVSNWPSIDDSNIYIDYVEALKTIARNPDMVVIRHFPADNGHREKISTAFKAGFDSNRFERAIHSSGILG